MPRSQGNLQLRQSRSDPMMRRPREWSLRQLDRVGHRLRETFSSQIAKSNGKSLMSRRRLPSIRMFNISKSDSVADCLSSWRAK